MQSTHEYSPNLSPPPRSLTATHSPTHKGDSHIALPSLIPSFSSSSSAIYLINRDYRLSSRARFPSAAISDAISRTAERSYDNLERMARISTVLG